MRKGGVTAQKLRQFAEGYLVLGLCKQAAAELSQLSREERQEADSLGLEIDLQMGLKNWGAAVDASRAYAELRPRDERGWVGWAFSLRELQRVEEARAVLLRAEPLLGPKCALLHYNLACYYCLLGELEEAKRRLALAVFLQPGFGEEALSDPDLRALKP